MDVLEQGVGLLLIVLGIALIAPPLAIIAAGLGLIAHGVLRELATKFTKENDEGNSDANSQRNTEGHA